MTVVKTKTQKAAAGLKNWDMAENIRSKADVVLYLEAALEENDVPFLLSVMGDIARSEGMSKIAREMGLSREGLYRSLAPGGNPSFETVVNLLGLLGMRLAVKRVPARRPHRKSA
jgi:probable addiction module antidote protein